MLRHFQGQQCHVHAGYDAAEGSLMARLNVEGNQIMPELARELDFPFNPCGSFVVCLDEESLPDLRALYERGVKNGVKDLEIITDKARIKEMEPNLADEVAGVLYAPTAGIVCPFNLNIALAENAYTNGVDFKFNTEVTDIRRIEGGWLWKQIRACMRPAMWSTRQESMPISSTTWSAGQRYT